jgi:hypothetical protein
MPGDELSDLGADCLMEGSVTGQSWKLGGFHEPLFEGEVLLGEGEEAIDPRSQSVVGFAVQHLFVHFIQTGHDRSMLLVQALYADRILIFPIKRNHGDTLGA